MRYSTGWLRKSETMTAYLYVNRQGPIFLEFNSKIKLEGTDN